MVFVQQPGAQGPEKVPEEKVRVLTDLTLSCVVILLMKWNRMYEHYI